MKYIQCLAFNKLNAKKQLIYFNFSMVVLKESVNAEYIETVKESHGRSDTWMCQRGKNSRKSEYKMTHHNIFTNQILTLTIKQMGVKCYKFNR